MLDINAPSVSESGPRRTHPNKDKWLPEIQRASEELEILFRKSGVTFRALAEFMSSNQSRNPGYGYQVLKRLSSKTACFATLHRMAQIVGYRARIVFEREEPSAELVALVPRKRVGRPRKVS